MGSVYAVSAVAHRNVKPVLHKLAELVQAVRELESQSVLEKDIPILTLADDPNAWWIDKTDDGFEVHGQKLEGFAKRTDFSRLESLARLRDILSKRGIIRELEKQGIKTGQTVIIAGKSFKW